MIKTHHFKNNSLIQLAERLAFFCSGVIMLLFLTLVTCYLYDMKKYSSLKSAKKRHPDCKVVPMRKKKKIRVVCKTDRRFNAAQGG